MTSELPKPRIVYRSVAHVLCDEPGRERFARDVWVEEYARDPPKRKKRGCVEAQRPLKGHAPVPRTPKYTESDMPQKQGFYQLVKIIPNKTGDKSGAFRVLARCCGPKCGGKERTFSIYEWGGRGRGASKGCALCQQANGRPKEKFNSGGAFA